MTKISHGTISSFEKIRKNRWGQGNLPSNFELSDDYLKHDNNTLTVYGEPDGPGNLIFCLAALNFFLIKTKCRVKYYVNPDRGYTKVFSKIFNSDRVTWTDTKPTPPADAEKWIRSFELIKMAYNSIPRENLTDCVFSAQPFRIFRTFRDDITFENKTIGFSCYSYDRKKGREIITGKSISLEAYSPLFQSLNPELQLLSLQNFRYDIMHGVEKVGIKTDNEFDGEAKSLGLNFTSVGDKEELFYSFDYAYEQLKTVDLVLCNSVTVAHLAALMGKHVIVGLLGDPCKLKQNEPSGIQEHWRLMIHHNYSIYKNLALIIAKDDKGIVDGMARILARNLSPNKALFDAASRGDLDAVKKWIDANADINSKHTDRRLQTAGEVYVYREKTPLFIAAEMGHYNIVKYLLDKGADPKIRDAGLWSPYDVALVMEHQYGKKECSKCVLALEYQS